MEANIKKNAVILTFLMLIKKLLSIIYKIPYQNLTGDAGFYVFQQVYSFIALLMILTGFALPTVIGSLLQENHYSAGIKDKIKRSMWIFSLICFTTFFLGNRQIALIMGDILLAPVIRIVGIHFLFLPAIAYMRGVLQSRLLTVKKIGYSIVVEQISRVLVVLAVISIFSTTSYNYYQIAQLALTFSLISPIITIMHLYLMKPVDDALSFLPLKQKPQFFRRTMYLLLSAGILVIYGLIDNFLVFNMLIRSQTQTDAMILKGILERGLPFVQAGTFFVASLVGLTMAQFEKTTNDEQKTAFATGVFYILGLAIPATVGLITVMPSLNQALFMDNLGNVTLQIRMLEIIPYSIIVLLTAILSKKARQPLILAALLTGTLVKLIITAPLVRQLGIDGAAISSVVGLLLMCIIMLIGAKSLLTTKIFANLLGISFSTLAMWQILNLAWPTTNLFNADNRSGALTFAALNILVGIISYVLILATLIWTIKAIKSILLYIYKIRKKRQKQAQQKQIQRQKKLRQQQEHAQQIYRQSLMHNQAQPNEPNHEQKLASRQALQSQYASSTKKHPKTSTKKEKKTMRLDKFLKVSRIIKRRQTAKEVSDAGKISVNQKVAKSSTVVNVGDEIALHYATRTLVVKVAQIKDSTKKEDADNMYEIVREEQPSKN